MGVYLAIAGIASGVIGGISSARAAKAQAASQKDAALKSEQAGLEFTEEQLGFLSDYADTARGNINDFAGSFQRTPNATSFIDDAIGLSQKGFDFQTDLKRQNLDYILGSSQENLRGAQNDFSALAAGDFSAFKNELNASLSRAGAEAFGSPVGTTFNIAARDRFNFRTASLNNTMKINDFFASEGTVDPPDPVVNAFALASFEQSENARKEQHNQFLLNSQLQTEQGIFSSGLQIGQVGLLAKTNALQTIGNLGGVNQAANAQTFNSISQGLGSAYGLVQQNKTNQQNQKNTEDYLQILRDNRQA